VVSIHFFANDALTVPNGLCDLALGLSGLLHVGDYFTVIRTEAVVFIAHIQFFL
jgi:hypothetical protein